MPRHKAGGHCPLRIRAGLFIPLSLCFSLYMILQFHVRERGIMQLLPKEDYLGHDIVGLNPPPQTQSVRENTSERGISEKTRIMQKRQKGLMKKLHRIIDERGEKLLLKPSGWHKYGYNRIRNHFNCDGLDADARPLPTSQDWDFYKKVLGLALSRDPIFKDPYIDGPPPFYAAHGARGRSWSLRIERY